MTKKITAAAFALVIGVGTAHAATYNISLSGTDAGFSQTQFSDGTYRYNRFSQVLTGLDSTNAITVSQGDTINNTVTFDGLYTIPTAPVRTDILQFLTGSSFPAENTAVNGTFTFFNGATQVAQFGYSSTTSDQLASFAAIFSPNNPAFTFDSFTNDLTIVQLAAPATLDGSSLTYDLVSPAVPEPATWAMMLAGMAAIGYALRRRAKVQLSYA